MDNEVKDLQKYRELKLVIQMLERLEETNDIALQGFSHTRYITTRELQFIINQHRETVKFYRDLYADLFEKLK